MNSANCIANTLSTLAGRGIAVTVSPAGKLQVRPASLLTSAEHDWFRAHVGVILAHLEKTAVGNSDVPLSGNEPWDRQVALRLTAEADALVERLGVSGQHPAIVSAAAMVVSAYATHDLETVRFAVAEFALCVRDVARERVSANGMVQTAMGERVHANVVRARTTAESGGPKSGAELSAGRTSQVTSSIINFGKSERARGGTASESGSGRR
jgi:hypothetical protein